MTDQSSSQAKSLRLLLVEDEPELLDIFARRLAHAGFIVTPVANGEDAIEKLSTQVFDAVVSDIQLPGKSGFDIFEFTVSQKRGLPFFFVTGHGEGTPEMSRALAAGADGVFSKPFFMPQLLDKLHQVEKRLGCQN